MNEEIKQEITAEEVIGPPKISLFEVGLLPIGGVISGFVGSIVIMVSIFLFLNQAKGTAGVYPFIYAITGFFATLVTAWLNIVMYKIINPDKYTKGGIVFAQVFMFYIFVFIFFLPIYIYSSKIDVEQLSFLLYVFSVHLIFATLGSSIIIETLSNYRYILLGVYGSFLGAIVSVFATMFILLNFGESAVSLYTLIGLLILVNTITNTIRVLFEYIYSQYYEKTGMDNLGDIYYQIEQEEKEILEEAKKITENFNTNN